ncbi:conserved hypothetical protein [delta proteobacterium NaphS2]|nr:conserved hypothetical protein [delta proteobacterium NaphS2]
MPRSTVYKLLARHGLTRKITSLIETIVASPTSMPGICS